MPLGDDDSLTWYGGGHTPIFSSPIPQYILYLYSLISHPQYILWHLLVLSLCFRNNKPKSSYTFKRGLLYIEKLALVDVPDRPLC